MFHKKKMQTTLSVLLFTFPFICSGSSEFAKIEQAAASQPTLRDYFLNGELSYQNGRCQFKNLRKFQETRLVDLPTFEQALDRFAQTMQQCLNKPDKWQGAVDRLPHILNPSPQTFLMYAQKLVFDKNDTLFFMGDLHGSVHTVIAYIRQLQELGYTSAENEFKIVKPNCYLIFLGDYVDRGLWGVEVMYLLLQLKIHNPDQVFLVRGNHEDPIVARAYGFQLEFHEKFNGATDRQLFEVYAKVNQFYNSLPIVLYVGAKSKGDEYDFLQVCHGGLEMGFNPKSLLNNEQISFETLHEIKRCTACLGPEYEDCFVRDERNYSKPLRALCKNFVPTSPTEPVSIGFAWHDFIADAAAISTYNPLRGFALDKKATDATLSAASTEKVRLVGIVRAHQHTAMNEDPLMKLLLASKGCAFLWKQLEKPSISQGMVVTLLLAPDTLMSVARAGEFDGFEYDTCLKLTIGDRIANWELEILNDLVYVRKAALVERLLKEKESQKESGDQNPPSRIPESPSKGISKTE